MRKLFLAWIFVGLLAGASLGFALPQDEGTAAACDNNREGKSKDVDHTCECPRAMMDCNKDDPEIKQPGSKCKTYCKPDNCDCQNKCTS